MDRIKVIKKKLEELKTLDRGFSIFGSERHKYELNPTLSEDQLLEIENENGIVLSKEYQQVLTQLGNGGAGCGYGLEAISLKHIDPPYAGTAHLLRNCDDPTIFEVEMVELDEITGYIKLFDYGCGMETCLIVKGEEQGGLIFFDCDGAFRKIEDKTLFDIYDDWLDQSISILKRVQKKLLELPLQEVIDSEWELSNYSVKEMALSLIHAESIEGGHSGRDKQTYLEQEYKKWRTRNF